MESFRPSKGTENPRGCLAVVLLVRLIVTENFHGFIPCISFRARYCNAGVLRVSVALLLDRERRS